MKRQIFVVGMVALLHTGPALSKEPLAEPLAHSDCAVIFGTDAHRQTNHARRVGQLYSVQSWLGFVEIQHSNPKWREPAAVTFSGLRVMKMEEKDGARVLRVQVAAGMNADCRTGQYLLGVDDSLGANARVLAIHRGGALLEEGGRLRAMQVPGFPPQGYRLIWRSGFEMVSVQSQGGNQQTSSKTLGSKMLGKPLSSRNVDLRNRMPGTKAPLRSTLSTPSASRNLMKMRSERIKSSKSPIN